MATEATPPPRAAVARVIARRTAARKANRHRHAEVYKLQKESDMKEREAREKAEAKIPKCDMCGKAL